MSSDIVKDPSQAAMKFALSTYLREYLFAAMRTQREGKAKSARHGLPSHFVRAVEGLDSAELEQFVQFAVARMSRSDTPLCFSIDELRNTEKYLLDLTSEKILIQDFARAGASQQMLTELFGLRKVDVSSVRTKMNITSSPGRPRALSDEERQRVDHAWSEMPHELDPRMRLLLVALEVELPLTQVFQHTWDTRGTLN
ncbi:MAG TPA: STY4526/YPO1902 family pathogenicity island replication protein [Marinobacterium sp.]|nr:STY4526/YPO1902 family pathogenicity island replication protein [Marinobacterium sp.]